MHYVLGHAGYYVVSADWDMSEKKSKTQIKWSRERALAIGRSQRLRHTVGINEFFCKLGAAARRNPDCELVDWIAERHVGYCTSFGAHPDAEGRWREGGTEIRFFLEYDRSTETLERLSASSVATANIGNVVYLEMTISSCCSAFSQHDEKPMPGGCLQMRSRHCRLQRRLSTATKRHTKPFGCRLTATVAVFSSHS